MPEPMVWSDACAPGGYVCAAPAPPDGPGIDMPDGTRVCGRPVESQPCGEHGPDSVPPVPREGGSPCVAGIVADVALLADRMKKAGAERDEAREQVARAGALLDRWNLPADYAYARDLRVALRKADSAPTHERHDCGEADCDVVGDCDLCHEPWPCAAALDGQGDDQ